MTNHQKHLDNPLIVSDEDWGKRPKPFKNGRPFNLSYEPEKAVINVGNNGPVSQRT